MQVTESPMIFGNDHALFGILSTPAEARPSSVGVLVLNSGLVNRAGPFRLGVEIARAVAASGIPAFRIDQSARGDSERRVGVNVVDAANLDIATAVSTFRSIAGVEQVVLAGLCSGADDIVRYCATNSDVSGMILFDPYAPTTWLSKFLFFAPRMLNPMKWFRLIRRKLSRNGREQVVDIPDLTSFREFPNCPQTSAALRNVSEIGGASLCVYTSGAVYYYSYKGQLVSGLGVKDVAADVEEVFLRSSEHTYPLSFHRKQLLRLVCDFMARRFQQTSTSI